MSENNEILKHIVWGSRLFVNSQFVCNLVILLARYYQGECTLSYVLGFVSFLQKQQKVMLYKELQTELSEFMQIEKFLHDKSVISYTVNRLFRNITQGRIKQNA